MKKLILLAMALGLLVNGCDSGSSGKHESFYQSSDGNLWSTQKERDDWERSHAKPPATMYDRKAYAENFEHEMLMKGYDYHVSVQGKENTILVIKYILIGRPFVTQFMNNSKMISNLKSLGFKKVILSTQYEGSYSYNQWEVVL